jgi:GH35 family endo-1,4-beta-xylanase
MAHVHLGCAVTAGQLRNTTFVDSIYRLGYRMLTPETEMCAHLCWPEESRFDFSAADEIYDWWLAHRAAGFFLHGHVLGFGHQVGVPRWLWEEYVKHGGFVRPPAEYAAILRAWVAAILERYPNLVNWNLVNETTNANGRAPGGFWYQAIDARSNQYWISTVANKAHQVAPGKNWWINEQFWISEDGRFKQAQLDEVANIAGILRGRGHNIVGIGLQGHYQHYRSWPCGGIPTREELDYIHNFFGLHELRMRVSEFDFTIRVKGEWPDEIPELGELIVQAGAYQRFATWVRDSAERPPISWGLNQFCTWAAHDGAASWAALDQPMGNAQPGLGLPAPLDRWMQPKPAYLAFADPLGVQDRARS